MKLMKRYVKLDCIGISFFRQDRQDVQDTKKLTKSC